MFVSDLWQVGGFLRAPPATKTDRNDKTEILLKVALNTITLTLTLNPNPNPNPNP
jgi:hypothetical protein